MAETKPKLSDLLTGSRELAQGVEAALLRRRRLSSFGAVLALGGAVLQFVAAAIDKGYVQQLATLLGLTANQPAQPVDSGVLALGAAGILALGLGATVYLLFKWTRFLQKESEEPFRYTVSIDAFAPVAETPGTRCKLKDEDRLRLLQLDIRERLDRRIGRFSLLDSPSATKAEDSAVQPRAPSHIHIEGKYALREERKGLWVLHVMPTVRLGAVGVPVTIARPVRFEIGQIDPASAAPELALGPDNYELLLERLYSSVATEVYAKIETDVKGKIALFPTPFLRAIALYHGAQDLARSNTVDAYDRAIELYREARRYFDLAALQWLSWLLLRIPLLWWHEARYVHARARLQIGYARCLIYRRLTSVQTGRAPNPIFECTWELRSVIADLEALHSHYAKVGRLQRAMRALGSTAERLGRAPSTRETRALGFLAFPKDAWYRLWTGRPLESDFARQRQILFDAYTVAALAHACLDATVLARRYLEDAAATDPSLVGRDPVYLFAAAEVEADLDQKALLYREAADLRPTFQIALFRLATNADRRFRRENDLSVERRAQAEEVTKLYEAVLRINPGNVAALAAQGYLAWLIVDNDNARRRFNEGIELKALVSETFVGELNYGLARVAAETNDLHRALALYQQAVAADPNVAAWRPGVGSRVSDGYYSFIGTAMLERYASFNREVLKHADSSGVAPAIGAVVASFALNDYANACMNLYFRLGDSSYLGLARDALAQSLKWNPEDQVARYNSAQLLNWESRFSEALECLTRVVRCLPGWNAARIEAATALLSSTKDEQEKRAENERDAETIKKIDAEIRTIDAAEGASQSLKSDLRDPVSIAIDSRDRKRKQEKERKKVIARRDQRQRELREGEDQRSTMLQETVANLTERTRLGPLLRGEARGDGSPSVTVARLLALSKRIRWERLIDEDFTALAKLADLESWNAMLTLPPQITDSVTKDGDGRDQKARQVLVQCGDLVDLLQSRFAPEYFDLNLTRCSIAIAYNQPLPPEAKGTIVRTVERWLTEDPLHYFALKDWAIDWLEPEARRRVLTRATEDPGASGAHWNLLAESLLDTKTADGYQKACTALNAAIARDAQRATYHLNLGKALAGLERWDEAARALERAASLEPDNRAILDELSSVRRNRSQRLVRDLFGASAERRVPLTTPIAIEIAANLIPLVAGANNQLTPAINKAITSMRERVQGEIGVRLPGLRLRGNEGDMPPNTYIVMLCEGPRVRGTVAPDQHFFVGPSESLPDALRSKYRHDEALGGPRRAPVERGIRTMAGQTRRRVVTGRYHNPALRAALARSVWNVRRAPRPADHTHHDRNCCESHSVGLPEQTIS